MHYIQLKTPKLKKSNISLLSWGEIYWQMTGTRKTTFKRMLKEFSKLPDPVLQQQYCCPPSLRLWLYFHLFLCSVMKRPWVSLVTQSTITNTMYSQLHGIRLLAYVMLYYLSLLKTETETENKMYFCWEISKVRALWRTLIYGTLVRVFGSNKVGAVIWLVQYLYGRTVKIVCNITPIPTDRQAVN